MPNMQVTEVTFRDVKIDLFTLPANLLTLFSIPLGKLPWQPICGKIC